MIRYVSPVNPNVYPHLAVTLLGIGMFFMAWFFVYPKFTSIGRVGVRQKEDRGGGRDECWGENY